MRTAGLPTFSKLYGRNDGDVMKAGTYELDVYMSTFLLFGSHEDGMLMY
jgi:hypothetical protein